MVTTNWRAVATGFIVIVVLGLIASFIQEFAVLGTAVGAIIGGFTAGYLARGNISDGTWNGFLAGLVGAVVVIAVLAVLGLAVSLVELSLGGVFATVGIAIAALVFAAIAAIPAAIGGALGGMVVDRRSRETRRPAV